MLLWVFVLVSVFCFPVTIEGGEYHGQIADEADQAVYDDDRFKWNAVKWQDKRLIQVRIPITTSSVSEYAFEAEGQGGFHFIGYSVEYQADGTMTIRGKRSD